MVLSVLASAAGAVLYLLPAEVLPSMNRISDFVVLNDGLFVVRDNPWISKLVHFPDYDPPDEHIRLVTIDEASIQDVKDGGIGRFPWPRQVHAKLLQKLAKAGAKVAAFDVEFFEHARDPKEDDAFKAGLRAQPTILGMSLAVTQGGVLSFLQPPPDIKSLTKRVGSTTVDNPGGWLVGQPLVISRPPTEKVPEFPSLAFATASYYLGKDYKSVDDWSPRWAM